MSVIVSEALLAKNSLTTVAGQTPYRALYGRDPPGLAEFEPTSETQLDDMSGGVLGLSRHHHRVRELAIAAMVQETAQLRLERALTSKTRVAAEQLDLQPGDLVDFWRKPATKDESGWRGPATVVEPRTPGGDPQGSAVAVVATTPAQSFPTEQRVRQRERKKQGHVAKRRLQVVEDHHDDCGEYFSPLGDDFFTDVFLDENEDYAYLNDDTDEVKIMAAWTLVNLGDSKPALATLEGMLFQPPTPSQNTTLLHNVMDWMGEPALPLVKKYIERGGNRQGKYGIGILGRVAQLNGW